MKELEPPAPHPLAAVHPRAYQMSCELQPLTMRGVRWCMVSFAAVAFLSLVSTAVDIRYRSVFTESPAAGLFVTTQVAAILAVALAITVAVLFLIRLVLVALFFARYSLAQLLGVTVAWGVCVTEIMKLDWPWTLFPIGALIVLFIVISTYVIAQDPAGAAMTPEFIIKAIEAQKKHGKSLP